MIFVSGWEEESEVSLHGGVAPKVVGSRQKWWVAPKEVVSKLATTGSRFLPVTAWKVV